MKRPMALFERAMYLEGDLHVSVMVTARIWGRLTEENLKHALAQVQAKHGILRCLIMQEKGRPYLVVQEQPPPIPLRIVERQSDEDWFDVSTQDSLQRFDGSKLPLARLIWLRSDLENELLLVCSHAICDGLSLLLLLKEILLLCDQPDADIGAPTSLNAIEEVFPAKVLTDKRLQRQISWKVAIFKLTLWFVRSGRKWTYGEVYRNIWRLDEPTSQLFIARCKKEGVNVFAALSLAFIQAFQKVCGPKKIEKFEAPVDFRRYLSNMRPDSLFAVAPTIKLSLQDLRDVDPNTSDFWTLARALKTDMTNKIDRLESSVYTLFLGMEHLHSVYDRMFARAQAKRAGYQVSLSYVGKLGLDQSYSNFRLQDICDISGMMSPTPANLVAIYSFAGQFRFSLSSDESSLPYSQAQQIQQQVLKTLTLNAGKQETPAVVSADVPSMVHGEVS